MTARSETEPDGEAGMATLMLVLGLALVLLLTIGTLAVTTAQHVPILRANVLSHATYRAAQAGYQQYLYDVNANPNLVVCGSSVPDTNVPGAPPMSPPCAGLYFDTWIQIASNSTGIPEWYLYDNPVLDTSITHPNTVQVTVIGAAGKPGQQQYQTMTVTLVAANAFLVNAYFMNHDMVDPEIVDPGSTETCDLFNPAPAGTTLAPETDCGALDFVPGDVVTGPLFSSDSIYVCTATGPGPSTAVGPTFGKITTGDSQAFRAESVSGSNRQVNACVSNATDTGETLNAPTPTIPNSAGTLAPIAKAGGCDYTGPTTIVFNGPTMTVSSPDTPVVGNKDANDQAGDPSTCLSATPVSLPANGLIYVEACKTGCVATDPVNSEIGGGQVPNDNGDAIISGTVTGPLTVATDTNIILDGNLCYSDVTNCAPPPSKPSGPSDVVGLIATNFVEVNHPVDSSGNNEPICGTNGAPAAPGCDLQNITIDATILTLTHSFTVNDFNNVVVDKNGKPTSANALGTITVWGSINQNYRGPVGTFAGSSDGSTLKTSGYLKAYNYDQRLSYLSPPYYLSPGTPSWTISAFTAAPGRCILSTGPCITKTLPGT